MFVDKIRTSMNQELLLLLFISASLILVSQV